ncbi:helix-turn-helix domain-containing protein [Paenibacillus durus]|uniref:DNA-binding protein n=1 Tax=Paenibacillus durus TaxID=44251 RepID=A0A089HSB6_PAEDU|nr:helix-turn-helix transcriptional regulator [Paenibacillus durus]AIQ13650.1 DNA-binding protein [Paenibacillus durus]
MGLGTVSVVRKIRVKLDEVLQSRGITQTELMKMSGVRQASISELTNNMRTGINREHLAKIADALEIDDISELITIEKE